jgi:hypothetical protein
LSQSFSDGADNDATKEFDGATGAEGASDTAAPPAADQGVTDAPKPEGKPFDPLAVTRQAIEATNPKAEEGDEGAPGPEAKKDEPPGPKGPDEPKEASEQDDAKLPFGKHPRFRQVISERNEARQKIADMEPDAIAYREVTDFMGRNSLKAEEVQEGFAIMAALKNDPARAWQMLSPHIERLRAVTGQVLPEDLRKRVDDGLVDEDTAGELARRRASEAHATASAAERRQMEADQRVREAGAARAAAVDGFINERSSKDPDFALKEPLLRGAILEAIERRRATNQPVVTPNDAVALVQGVYDDLGKKVAALRGGQRRDRGPIGAPPSGMSSSTPALPAPRTPLDVTRMALATGG